MNQVKDLSTVSQAVKVTTWITKQNPRIKAGTSIAETEVTELTFFGYITTARCCLQTKKERNKRST